MSAERFGVWQLDALIAVGGLGEIWRGSRDGATVAAVKRLHTHLVRNDEIRAQFALEQQLTTGLPRHPNLVHAIEAGSVGNRPYIALALIPGEDLRRRMSPSVRGAPHLLAPGPVLPWSRVRTIITGACAAVAHLHRHGFVHGDINPGNLIVSNDDQVVVVDLGIAREIGRGGAVRGTHAYMAPEQVRGEPWTAATDVFALGVVLWELVAGARLFHRGPPWLSMAAVVEVPVPALPEPALDERSEAIGSGQSGPRGVNERPAAAGGINAIVQAALAKDPARRIASPDDLADRLAAT
jgi:serine/threonine protein kinase